MDMTPVFRPSISNQPQAPEQSASRAAATRPFTSIPAPVAPQVNSPPQQVFVSQGRPGIPTAQQTPQAPVTSNAQATVPGQPMPGNFEKTISQVVAFFFGDKKDKTEEKELRKRNEYAKTGLFGEDRKVEESNKSEMGGGQS